MSAFSMPIFKKKVVCIEKISCPNCGYKMPIYKTEKAKCIGVFVKCKNPKCKKEFEIKIECQ